MEQYQLINIVYLKRDLRLHDNPSIVKAEELGLPYLIIYIFEPSLRLLPTWDIRHWRFIYGSLLNLDKNLNKYGHSIKVFWGEALEIFQYLLTIFKVKCVVSHQEVGVDATFKRDIRLRRFFKKNHVTWIEIPWDGIQRGKNSRDGWKERVERWFSEKTLKIYPKANLAVNLKENHFELPYAIKSELSYYPNNFQAPGEEEALKVLKSFCERRLEKYLKSISKPYESQVYSSRLSPYLAYGNISARKVYQSVQASNTSSLSSRNAFISRLFWRSHFIQKFESLPEYEFESINAAFKPWPFEVNHELIQAWAEGETGVDLVDAVMKCLKATGWINFRMRAMVVSFFCHALKQPWEFAANTLAKLFLDFEPGIHYPQIQMQAGVTGYNTIRIYDPEKQLRDNDRFYRFCKMWLPTKRPKPIVNWRKNLEEAKAILWRIKKSELAKRESERLLQLQK